MASTDNKNEIGTWTFLGVVLNCLYLLREKSKIAYILLLIMMAFSISTFSSKILFPNLLCFIYTLTVSKQKIFSIFVLIAIVSFIFLFSSTHYDKLYDFIFQMISKNLAIFDARFTVGQHAVSTRTSLIIESLEFYMNGNLILGQGLESERYKIGTYSHNSYVSVLVGGGLLGLLFFIILLLQHSVTVLKTNSKLYRRFFFIVLIGLLIMLFALRFWDSIPLIFVFSILFNTNYFKAYHS